LFWLQALQAKCDSLIKDRDAVTSIMEDKIKVLSRNVAQSVSRVYSTHPEIGDSSEGVALTQDLAALQRMVGASIAALKNAANAAKAAHASTGGSANPGGASGGSIGPNSAGVHRPVPLGGTTPASSAPPRAGGPGPSAFNRNAPVNGSYPGSTPLSLPMYPGSSVGGGGSLPSTAYATPGAHSGSVSSGQRAPMQAWGARDEGYSAGDVYRSADRR
jgi:hypothetical protein